MADIPEVSTTEGANEEQPKTYDEAYVKELRAEAAKHRMERNEARKRVEELDGKVKGFEDADKSELEKLAAEKARLEQELVARDRDVAEREMKAQVFNAAARLNIVDPDIAYLALDLADIDADDPKGIEKALRVLIKDKPYLVKAGEPPTPGVGGPSVQAKKSTDDQWSDMLKAGAKHNKR